MFAYIFSHTGGEVNTKHSVQKSVKCFLNLTTGSEQHQEKPWPGAECSVAQQKSSETGSIRKQRVGSSQYSVHLVFTSVISRIIGGAGVFTHSDETGPVWRGDDLLYLWSVFCVHQ